MPTGVYPRKKKNEVESDEDGQAVLSGVEVQPKQEPTEAAEPEAPKKFTPFTRSDAPTSKSKISFTLDGAGRPDVASMRDDTKEKLKSYLRDPELRKALLGQDTVAGIPDFTDADARAIYQMLGPIEGYVFALSMKVPVELAQKVFTYTPEEMERLIPPTVALLNKYKEYLTAYAEWKEEINLGMALFMITRAKIEILKVENQKRIDAKPINPALQRHDYVPTQPEKSFGNVRDFATMPGSESPVENAATA